MKKDLRRLSTVSYVLAWAVGSVGGFLAGYGLFRLDSGMAAAAGFLGVGMLAAGALFLVSAVSLGIQADREARRADRRRRHVEDVMRETADSIGEGRA